MTISRVCEATGLTKKAVRYYEKAGLVSPQIGANGYRQYSDSLVERLKVVAALRRFGLSVDQTRACLEGEQAMRAQLSRRIEQLRHEREREAVEADLLETFLEGRGSLSELSALLPALDRSLRDRPGYLRRRLRELFPGDLGEVIGLAYGYLLDDTLETAEQHAAWTALVAELDEVEEVPVPEELSEWARTRNRSHAVAENVERLTEEYSSEYEQFAAVKREAVQGFLAEVPKEQSAAAYRGARLLADFLAGDGSAVFRIFQRHLPALSRKFERFAAFQARFQRDNPDITAQIRSRLS